jgi:hypothetical protein
MIKRCKKSFSSIMSRVGQRAFILLIILLFSIPVNADFPEEQPGANAAALAYSLVASTNGWSLFYNQAGLGNQINPWVGVHHENRFLAPELSFTAIGASLPVGVGAIGVSVKQLGFSQFHQTKFGLAYGMKLAPTFSAGVQLNGHYVFIAGEYGSAFVLSAEGGLIYSPSERLNIGFHIVNPTRTKLYEDQRIPTIVNLGVAYDISDMVMVTAGVQKNLDEEISFKTGLEFMPIKNLYFRTGMATKPSLLTFGMGYELSSIMIDLAFTRHELLGYTPHFSLSYNFSKSKKRSDSLEFADQ